jgi:hypothetical protein
MVAPFSFSNDSLSTCEALHTPPSLGAARLSLKGPWSLAIPGSVMCDRGAPRHPAKGRRRTR